MNGYKLAAQKQWSTTPCGTGDYLDGLEYGSLEFFEAVRHSRYNITDPWMTETINFTIARGKKLLEIGYGLGTDLLTFCEGGAEVYGIDMTEEHYRLAQRNIEVQGKKCRRSQCPIWRRQLPSCESERLKRLSLRSSSLD